MNTAEKIIEAKKALNAVRKQYYQQHFYDFNRDILGWKDLYEPLHRRVCDFVQDNIEHKKILLLLPRGTFKSSIVTVGLTNWLIAKNPQNRTMIANATYPMAVQFLGQVKNHLQRNNKFHEIFGNYATNADQWREDRIFLERTDSFLQKEATVSAYGMGGNLVGSHFDYAILDDVVARENIGTKDQIEKTKNFYKDVLDLVDPLPSGHKRVVIIGTTWHWDDLYAWIQSKDSELLKDFAVMRLPAYEGEWGKGKLLFPTRLNWKTLKTLKEQQGNAHFHAQYMLDPIAEEDQTFRGPFKRYEQTDLRDLPMRYFFAIDPAISESKQADFSAMVCVGVDKDGTWYIVDVWRRKVQPKDLIDQIFIWSQKWNPVSIGLETTAYQRMLQYEINDQMKKRGHFIPIKELKHVDKSKEDRIKGLQPRYEVGNILHPDPRAIPDIVYLEDELLRFPKGGHDDLCFVAGTKILTDNGQVKIEDIRPGCLVMTRNGYRKVIANKMTGKKRVINKLGLTGTPNHPIITTKGICELQKVKASDTLYMWNEKLSCIEERSIIDIQNQKEDNLGFIFGDTINGKSHRLHFIDKFGLIALVKYLKDLLYITKMKIPLITKYPTLSYSINEFTQADMHYSHTGRKWEEEILNSHKRQLNDGIQVKREGHGILNTQKKDGRILGELRKSVFSVKRNIQLHLETQSIALTYVEQNIEEVYNLKVEGTSEYFANNILVHNCDALASLNELAFAPRVREERKPTSRSHYPA